MSTNSRFLFGQQFANNDKSCQYCFVLFWSEHISLLTRLYQQGRALKTLLLASTFMNNTGFSIFIPHRILKNYYFHGRFSGKSVKGYYSRQESSILTLLNP